MKQQPALRPAVVCLLLMASFAGSAFSADRTVLPMPLSDADFHPATAEQVELGRLLFYDKVLSGNRNISCASCHHALAGTGDGLSLSIGEGGCGLGVLRDTGRGEQAVVERVPRNAPPVFNLGASEVDTMFHDGRVQVDPLEPGGFLSPAGADLPDGLENVVAAQAMFPVTSATEMAGQPGENAVADAAAAGDLPSVWRLLARRLRAIDAYVDRFVAAYTEIDRASDIRFVHAANAIAAFEAVAWRTTSTPFDRYLAGETDALSASALAGMELFYGAAGCDGCHSGRLLSDQRFHAIAMPQIGPGKGDGVDGHEDFGRERVTGNLDDRYAFRTPPLRNTAVTGAWGHDGAYNSLEAMVRHHLDPQEGLADYDPGQAVLPFREDLSALDFMVQQDPTRVAAIAARCELLPVSLSESEITQLMHFLVEGLTDPAVLDLRVDVPSAVPSGLPLAECVLAGADDDENDDDEETDDDRRGRKGERRRGGMAASRR